VVSSSSIDSNSKEAGEAEAAVAETAVATGAGLEVALAVGAKALVATDSAP
jgi:hypothetical protein